MMNQIRSILTELLKRWILIKSGVGLIDTPTYQNTQNLKGIILVRDIIEPESKNIFHIAYIPKETLMGISKIYHLVHLLKDQVKISVYLQEVLKPKGCAILVDNGNRFEWAVQGEFKKQVYLDEVFNMLFI